MAATSMAAAKKGNVAPKSKVSIADLSLNDKVAKLLELAASAPKQSLKQAKSSAKLFELVVLADLLEIYSAQHGAGTVRVQNAASNVLCLAGAPCSADKSTFSYFELLDFPGGLVVQEAWVSVQVTTLSWSLSGAGGPVPRAGKHEIDVGVFSPLTVPYPDFQMLCAGFSCKHFAPLKECVREAIGLRRETALLERDTGQSATPWLVSEVPARPPSPLFLVSSSAGVYAYQNPVSNIGVFMMCVPFVS